MKILNRPIATTIIYGLICGLSFIPMSLALGAAVSGARAICLALWLFAAGYALFLSRWSRQRFSAVLFPMLILFLAVFLVDSIAAFYILVLAVTSWIRSGICFQDQRGLKLTVEILLCGVGGFLVTVLTPGTALGWAMGVWMFFLLQSLYFVIFDDRVLTPAKKHAIRPDPFEQASRQAEAILDNYIAG